MVSGGECCSEAGEEEGVVEVVGGRWGERRIDAEAAFELDGHFGSWACAFSYTADEEK